MNEGSHPPAVANERLPPAVRTLWRVGPALVAMVVAVVALVLAAATGEAWVAPAGGAGATLVFTAGWILADLHYRAWRWGLDEHRLETRHGVIVRTTQIVPRTRVQTLTTRTGPVDRRLGLTTVVVHTAGTHTPNLVIPHVGADAVARLQRELGG